MCSADPSQCTAHGDGLKQAQQYKKAQFTIEAKDKNGAPMKVGGNDFDIKTSLPEQVKFTFFNLKNSPSKSLQLKIMKMVPIWSLMNHKKKEKM